MVSRTASAKTSEPIRRTEPRRVADLKPNPVNGGVFTFSLTDDGLKPLVDDIRRNGGQPTHAIEILEDGTILNGERRWRVLMALGVEETTVIVRRDRTEDDVAGFVLDSFNANRDATVEERVGIYKLALGVLRQRHGRPAGRPNKSASNDGGFWDPKEIETEAGRQAGLGSASRAQRALRVFEDGDEALRAAVNAGETSINAAYKRILKREREHNADQDGETSAASNNAEEAVVVGSEPRHQANSEAGTGSDDVDLDDLVENSRSDQDDDEDPEHGGDEGALAMLGDDDATVDNADLGSDVNGESDPADGRDDDVLDIGFDVAWQAVLNQVGEDRQQIRGLVGDLVAVVDLDCWVEMDERRDNMIDLASKLWGYFEQMAAEDPEGADGWLDGHCNDLSEAIRAHAHHDDE